MNKTETFHALHHRDEPLILPNAWDFGSAAVLAAAGFPAIGTTSLGVAAAAGLPDGAGATGAETLAVARRLARLPLPVTVDIEGGFGETPAEVAAYTGQLAEFGIAGVNVEDGRGDVALIHPDRQAELIAAIKARSPGLFVNARVDTYWLNREHDSTLDRAERYAAAGADGIFVPGVTDTDHIGRLAAALPLPLNILYSPDGPSIATLAASGVRRISTGSLLYRAAVSAAADVARTVQGDRRVRSTVPSYRELRAVIEAGA